MTIGGGAWFWAGEGAGAAAGNWTGPFTGAPAGGAETFGDWLGVGFTDGAVGVIVVGVEQILAPLGMTCGVGLTQGCPPVLF